MAKRYSWPQSGRGGMRSWSRHLKPVPCEVARRVPDAARLELVPPAGGVPRRWAGEAGGCGRRRGWAGAPPAPLGI